MSIFVSMYASVHVCMVSEECGGSSDTGIIGGCKPLCGHSELNLGPLQEPLTTEQTFQPTPRHFDAGFSEDLSLLPLQLERMLKSCSENALEDSRLAACCWICAVDSI